MTGMLSTARRLYALLKEKKWGRKVFPIFSQKYGSRCDIFTFSIFCQVQGLKTYVFFRELKDKRQQSWWSSLRWQNNENIFIYILISYSHMKELHLRCIVGHGMRLSQSQFIAVSSPFSKDLFWGTMVGIAQCFTQDMTIHGQWECRRVRIKCSHLTAIITTTTVITYLGPDGTEEEVSVCIELDM